MDKNLNKTFNKEQCRRLFGAPFVHPVEYWACMWRFEGKNGIKYVVKCPQDDHCILYYSENGQEKREALTRLEQLPVEKRKELNPASERKKITPQTPLTFENATLIFGEPYVDPDVPFVYEWVIDKTKLVMIGKVFSIGPVKSDDRATVSIFGHLPPNFRKFLNNQGEPAPDNEKSAPVDVVNPRDVLKPTAASEATQNFEEHPDRDIEHQDDLHKIPTVADLHGDDLAKLIEKDTGIETRTLPVDDDFPDDDDSYVAPITEPVQQPDSAPTIDVSPTYEEIEYEMGYIGARDKEGNLIYNKDGKLRRKGGPRAKTELSR